MLQFMGNLFTTFLTLQEVDEPLQLDMSELCLSNDFSQGNDCKCNYFRSQHTFFLYLYFLSHFFS